MLDFEYDFQNSSLPSAPAIDNQPSNTSPIQMSVASDFLGTSSCDGGYWNHASQGDMINNHFRVFPGNISSDTTYHTSHNLVANRRDSYPLETENTSLGPTKGASKVRKPRILIAKPAVSPVGVAQGTNSSKRSSKIGRRTGPLPPTKRKSTASMRKRGACAHCLVNHVEVGTINPLHKLG
jgi:hypothetical protein